MWPEDKDLEFIFKEGSKQYDHSYDPAAWDQMDAMLDRQRRWKFFLWFAAGALILMSAWGIFHYVGGNEPVSPSKAELLVENRGNTIDKESKSPVVNDNLNTNTPINNAKVDINSDVAIVNDVQNVVKEVESVVTTNGATLTASNTENSANTRAVSNGNIRSKDNLVTTTEKRANLIIDNKLNTVYSGTSNNATIDNQRNNQLELNEEAKIVSRESAQIEVFNIASLNSLEIQPFSTPLNITQQLTIVESVILSEIPFRRFLISGFAGVESSWTPNSTLSSIDLSIGLKGAYLITDKIAFSLGANYRADRYTAGQSDYNPDLSFWESGIMPMFTNAENDMLEISTGIFYTPAGAHNSGLLFSGQLVSNIMLKEQYSYNFEDANNNFESAWTGSNNTLIGNLELGAGYRRRLNNGLSLEVSPYIKVPVNGIGHGKLKLSSYGLRMAINLGL